MALAHMIQSYFTESDEDYSAQLKTFHVAHEVSFLVLENRFRLDWAVTFPNTAEGRGSNAYVFNIYGFLDATQGQSRCSSYTSQIFQSFESENMFSFLFKNHFSVFKVSTSPRRESWVLDFRHSAFTSGTQCWLLVQDLPAWLLCYQQLASWITGFYDVKSFCALQNKGSETD